MGFRTVVVLMNDLAAEWEYDPELGRKIWMSAARPKNIGFQYGHILEQEHGDCQTVAILDGYGGQAVAHGHWHRDETEEHRNIRLLREYADAMGYRIVKKPAK